MPTLTLACLITKATIDSSVSHRFLRKTERGRRWRGAEAEGSWQSTNPLLLLRLIIFLHASTNLPFFPPLSISPQILACIHSLWSREGCKRRKNSRIQTLQHRNLELNEASSRRVLADFQMCLFLLPRLPSKKKQRAVYWPRKAMREELRHHTY